MAVETNKVHSKKSGKSRQEWDEHYASGFTPWDTEITPPEVKAFWEYHSCQQGSLALDLGCGTGTNVNYLRSLGMNVIGVDLSGLAILRAQCKLGVQDGSWRIVQADVCKLPFQNIGASYILDIGCLHRISTDLRRDYAAGVVANLRPGGYYQLFAFDRMAAETKRPGIADRGMLPNEVDSLFSPYLTTVSVIYGRPSRQTCRWYLLRKW